MSFLLIIAALPVIYKHLLTGWERSLTLYLGDPVCAVSILSVLSLILSVLSLSPLQMPSKYSFSSVSTSFHALTRT